MPHSKEINLKENENKTNPYPNLNLKNIENGGVPECENMLSENKLKKISNHRIRFVNYLNSKIINIKVGKSFIAVGA